MRVAKACRGKEEVHIDMRRGWSLPVDTPDSLYTG